MRVVAFFVAFVCACALKTAPHNKSDLVANDHGPKQEDVNKLHEKLETMAIGLEKMLTSKGGALGETKIGPELKTFVTELKTVLVETQAIKDPAEAMKKLQNARAGLATLTGELTSRQESLMKEEESQRESLLLGVLMTRQKESMEKQLDVLRSNDFVDLPVSQFLLSKHENTTALYMQVAGYLDAHKGANTTNLLVNDAKSHNAAAAKAESLAASFEQRVQSLQKSHDAAERRHKERMEFLRKGAEKAPKSAKAMKAMMKREERSFKKWSVMQEHDIETMKDAVKAIRKHDVKALEKAKEALEASVRGLQNKNAGFLVLLSMGHRLMERDCPYCAAQCVDKCHQEGKPYVACLTQCADAGK